MPSPEKATHDYKRNGTTTLFAALEVATGKVTDACYDRQADFRPGLADRGRQLPHPQAPRDQRLAGEAPADPLHFTPSRPPG